jgi:hypothetical protein
MSALSANASTSASIAMLRCRNTDWRRRIMDPRGKRKGAVSQVPLGKRVLDRAMQARHEWFFPSLPYG